MNRRRFIRTAGLAAGSFFIPAVRLYGQELSVPASKQFRFAAIGAGGMGRATTSGIISGGGTVAALCDTDVNRLAEQSAKYPGIPCFTDYREMLEKCAKDIDAVHVSTPDHMHAYPALEAMELGKHAYVQKPLAHTFEECELLAAKARAKGLVCQMGNQGHPGVWRYKAILTQADVWGGITSIEAWSDRPDVVRDGKRSQIWPQGMTEYPKPQPYTNGYTARTWDIWCGPAPDHGYARAFLPSWWRGWWDYGCGPIGDMAVHNADPAFWLFDLGLPVAVEGDTRGAGPLTIAFPKQSVIRMTFAPKPLFPQGVTLTWYDGGLQPQKTPDMNPSFQFAPNGFCVRGTKAVTCGGSHAGTPMVIAAGGHAWNEESKELQRVCNRIMRDVKGYSHYREWVDACREGRPEKCGSNFDYAASLTESLLIGCISLRFPGVKLAFDPVAKRFTNCPAANAFLRAPRRGSWRFDRFSHV